MNRKYFIFIVAAAAVTAIAGLLASNIAFAQAGSPLYRIHRLRIALGKITEIGDSQFTIEKRDGTELNVTVNDTTRYKDPERTELSFEDLKLGRWVGVAGGRRASMTNLARLVVVFPEDFDPSQFEALHGEIAGVDIAGNSFSLDTPSGDQQVNIDNDTVFRSQPADLDDLEEGMLAGVIAKEIGGEAVLAKSVRAGYPVQRHVGQILEIDLPENTFTLKTLLKGEELVISVNSNTRIRSNDGTVSSLGDLKLGMTALVLTREQNHQASSEPLLAVVVGALEKKAFPKFDQRFGGRIISIEQDEFTIENRQGETVQFQTTRATLYRIGLRRQASFEELRDGRRVLVGAKEFGNGLYQAHIVVILPRW